MTPPPVLVWLGAAAVQQALPSRDATRTWSWGGGSLVIAAGGLGAASVSQFARTGTTVDPRAAARPTHLVTTGVSGRTRNPMYLAMTVSLVGRAVMRRSPAAAVPALVFAVWADRSQIPREEAVLSVLFGEEFERYRARVRRWL